MASNASSADISLVSRVKWISRLERSPRIIFRCLMIVDLLDGRPSVTVPKLVPSEFWCSRSCFAVSFAGPLLLTHRLVSCIHHLDPQPFCDARGHEMRLPPASSPRIVFRPTHASLRCNFTTSGEPHARYGCLPARLLRMTSIILIVNRPGVTKDGTFTS